MVELVMVDHALRNRRSAHLKKRIRTGLIIDRSDGDDRDLKDYAKGCKLRSECEAVESAMTAGEEVESFVGQATAT